MPIVSTKAIPDIKIRILQQLKSTRIVDHIKGRQSLPKSSYANFVKANKHANWTIYVPRSIKPITPRSLK